MIKYKGYQKFWAGIIGVILQGLNLYLPQIVEIPPDLTQGLIVVLAAATAFAVKQLKNQ